jgi:hypothetical protein
MWQLKRLGITSHALPISTLTTNEQMDNQTQSSNKKCAEKPANIVVEDGLISFPFYYDAILITDDVSWQAIDTNSYIDIYTCSHVSYIHLRKLKLSANLFFISKELKLLEKKIAAGDVTHILYMQTKNISYTFTMSNELAKKVTVKSSLQCQWLKIISEKTIEQLITNQYNQGLVIFNQQEADNFVRLCKHYQLLPLPSPIIIPHRDLEGAINSLSESIVILPSNSDVIFAQNIENYLFEVGQANSQQADNFLN